MQMEDDGGYNMIRWLDDGDGGRDGLVTREIMEKGQGQGADVDGV